MGLLAATNKQVPEHSILDHFEKQTYLGNQYSAEAAFTVGASEIPLLLITNVQTGSPSRFISLFNNLLKVVEKTASQSIILNCYINPTVTGPGTPVTPVNLRSSYGVAGAVALIASAPSVSANGTLVDSISAAALSVSQSQILKIIDQGQSMLITGLASASSTSILAIYQWFEI